MARPSNRVSGYLHMLAFSDNTCICRQTVKYLSGRIDNDPKKRSEFASQSLQLHRAKKGLPPYFTAYDAALAPSGLKTTQRAILAQISRCESTTVGGLAEALVMDAGELAHTLKPLERDGLVSIDVDRDDRRNRVVRLTPAGRTRQFGQSYRVYPVPPIQPFWCCPSNSS
jgi:DNA-binding MarR family transcriptional regulator